MPLLTEANVVARAAEARMLRKGAREFVETASADAHFDVFLSHSSNEPEAILMGVKGYLEDAGLSVYVDKYDDPHLSPDNVNPETAETLRHRLKASQSLLYVHSRHSRLSRWMPWELGFMDGAARKIGIAPVVDSKRNTFDGEQYLGLYPYIREGKIKGKDERTLWIARSPTESTRYLSWIRGRSEIPRRSSRS